MNVVHRIGAALVLAILSCTPASAQICSLHGTVVDADGGEPLEFVNAYLANTTSGTSCQFSVPESPFNP